MWLHKLFFPFLIVAAVSGFDGNVTDIDADSFSDEIELWAKSDEATETFRKMLQLLQFPVELQNEDWKSFQAETTAVAICTICKSVLNSFMNLRKKGMSDEVIQQKVIKLCVSLHIQDERVCTGVVQLNAPIIFYIIDSRPTLTASTICGVVLESKSCPLDDLQFEWSVAIKENRSAAILENEASSEEVKILQLTDIHYDPRYEANSNAKCGEPACCRKGQNTSDVTSVAGFWGDYESCDAPWNAVADALSHANRTHKDIDWVYFTGDIVDHGVWETTEEGNRRSIIKVYDAFHCTFGHRPVYPIIGNHESNPLNQYAPENITRSDLTTQWLYHLLADLWIGYGWLPWSTRSTIVRGGYYTVTPRKGFRIVALNSNVCYTYNWWLWYAPKDPDNQLQWLVETLYEAEKNNEFVHILSHIPPNSNNCLRVWNREYLRIINRFSHVVRAEFNGHTHNDELAVVYNSNGEASSVAWNGAGITTYTKLNPNYKVYEINSSNYAVTDYQNWMYDLSAANQHPDRPPIWYKSYSFREEYGLANLSMQSFAAWLPAALQNQTLLNRYYRNFYKQAKPSLQESCDSSCKAQLLSRIIVRST